MWDLSSLTRGQTHITDAKNWITGKDPDAMIEGRRKRG